MKLWLLRPVKDWEPWFDKAFGFVVRAETEDDARRVVSGGGGSPTHDGPGDEGCVVWENDAETTCVELTTEGDPGIIIRDFAAA